MSFDLEQLQIKGDITLNIVLLGNNNMTLQ